MVLRDAPAVERQRFERHRELDAAAASYPQLAHPMATFQGRVRRFNAAANSVGILERFGLLFELPGLRRDRCSTAAELPIAVNEHNGWA